MKQLWNKQIILGVSGGIAAYKSAELLRLLTKAGAKVQVVMTESAKEFITPMTMQALSSYPVRDSLFDVAAEAAMGHIELARFADAIIIAPATADTLSRLASGRADDLLSTVCLASLAPVIIAPAMNEKMWQAPATQANLQTLKARQFKMVGPDFGQQACGDVGPGRMIEPTQIFDEIVTLFSQKKLAGKQVLVTAGPTHEAIDPVRYIANKSSGKMGFAMAEAAYELGASVDLIAGPCHVTASDRINRINVTTAKEMYQAVHDHISKADIFISSAAIADYYCENVAAAKIASGEQELILKLKPNPDILSSVTQLPNKPFCIGFAAQSEDLIAKAQAKLIKKKADLIIANDISDLSIGFNSDDNAVTVLWGQQQQSFPRMPKTKLARLLMEFITNTLKIGS